MDMIFYWVGKATEGSKDILLFSGNQAHRTWQTTLQSTMQPGIITDRYEYSQIISELVKTDGYLEWLELAASFTVQSVQNWQYSTNSIHYLLALWARLVAAVPYVRPETGVRGHLPIHENKRRPCKWGLDRPTSMRTGIHRMDIP